jgi:hypothetical protein
MAMLIDLNARRAAAASATREPKTLRVNERDFVLRDQIPLAVVAATNDGDLVEAARRLLADPDNDFNDFIEVVSIDELAWLISNYGASLGESSGSTPPSDGTGEPSPPTSDASTTSTSAPVAMDPALTGQPTSSP